MHKNSTMIFQFKSLKNIAYSKIMKKFKGNVSMPKKKWMKPSDLPFNDSQEDERKDLRKTIFKPEKKKEKKEEKKNSNIPD